MKWLLVILITMPAMSSFASTGPAGFAVGIGTAIEGIDFSDGVVRTNVGGIMQQVDFGIHTGDFAFLLNGSFMDIGGSLNDYLASADVEVKWYVTENWFFFGTMGLAQFKRSSYQGATTTYITDFGGSTGGAVGWDIYSGNASQPFRLSLNIAAKRYDFGSTEIRQGSVVSDQDLVNHVNGLAFYGFIGLDWYL